MKIRAIIQARMLSKRLRGKSLMSVAGIPLLYRVVKSVKQFNFIDEIMVATTRAEADDPIAAAANNLGVDIFRGDSMNVLKRFRDASADLDEEDIIIRFTADNPIYNIQAAQEAFKLHKKGDFDYTYIDGLSHVVPEIIKVRALKEVSSMTEDDFDKEHVTPYLRKNLGLFKVQKLPSDFYGLRDDLDRFLTIDTEEDLHRYESMLSELKTDDYSISFHKIYEWLDKYENISNLKNGLTVKLGSFLVGDNQPTFVIAEIGQNHNGEIELAKQLIEIAVRCGANAVKFQKRDIPSELTKEAYNRPYNSPNSFGKTYGEHREFLELNEKQHQELKEYALAKGIIYFCTPCDIPSVEMMERLQVPFYKVASRDLTNIPLLIRLGLTGKPVIISTGMASLEDIHDALDALGTNTPVIILQCISQYPAQIDRVNLKAMHTLKEKFNKVIGFSDHTPGIIASVTASIMGAAVIEKHITLSRAMKGSDQAGSLEEPGLKKMIEYIRLSEKAKGDGIKEIDPATTEAKEKLARSITSKVTIPVGTIITEEMICLKSPGTGLKWKEKEIILNKKAKINIAADTTLKTDHFE